MKKMPYAVIFIVLLIVLVFAGCLSFSNSLGVDESTTEEEIGSDGSDAVEYETVTELVTGEVVTDAAGEAVTDAVGETVTQAPHTVVVQVPVTKPATTKNDNNNTPTVKPDSQASTPQSSTEKTTSGGTSGNDTPVVQSQNDFDILSSGTFYCTGTMTDQTNVTSPLEMAITANTVYMLSDFEGASMGILVKDGTPFMIYNDGKAYLELTPTLLKVMGVTADDLSLNVSDLGFTSFGSLDNATSKDNVTLNGTSCICYNFVKDTGSTKIYMNGNKLMQIDSMDKAGTLVSRMTISSITGTVPTDKCNPPADFKAYKGTTGLISFMSLLSDVIS